MTNSLKMSMIRNLMILVCSALILTACNSSKLTHEDEKKCPYLEGKDE